MDTAEILRVTRVKLAGPDSWTKGCFARTDGGTNVSYESKDAVCWCLQGALFSVTDDTQKLSIALDMIEGALFDQSLPFDTIPKYNDAPETTHSDILATLDRAIAAAEFQS
jgi:hypothetical protein